MSKFAHIDLVNKALADLTAEGKVRPRPSQPEVEQDKGLVTQRAAYYVNTQRDPSLGVFQKSGGNVYTPPPEVSTETFSVDWILRQYDGDGWDVVSDNWDELSHTGTVVVVEGESHGANPDNIPRWRMPTETLAQMPEDGSGGGNGDGGTTPTPPVDRTDEVLQAIADSEARLKAHMTSETDRVMQRLADYRQEVINFAEIAGKVLVVLGILRRP